MKYFLKFIFLYIFFAIVDYFICPPTSDFEQYILGLGSLIKAFIIFIVIEMDDSLSSIEEIISKIEEVI